MTRADIVAIHEDWKALGRGLNGPPPTIAEFMTFLLGAIQDPLPGPRSRARMAAAARRREARRRAEREAREQLAQSPPQTAAAA